MLLRDPLCYGNVLGVGGCVVNGCGKPVRDVGRQWCSVHYDRWYRHGDPQYESRRCPDYFTAEERLQFFGWAVSDGGCWEWAGRRRRQKNAAYGVVKMGRKNVPAHRVAYEVWVGPIPPGQIVRHDCDNPPCIRPDHLRLGYQSDNVNDMVSRGRQSGGRKHSLALMTEVKQKYRSGGFTQAQLEQAYGLSGGTVSRLMSGKIWAEIP